jgi:hypothetical protein
MDNKYWNAYITLEMPLKIVAEDNQSAEQFMAWAQTIEGKQIIMEQLKETITHYGRARRCWDAIKVDLDGETTPQTAGGRYV